MIPLVYPSDRSYGVGTKYKIYITVSKFIVKNRINVKNNDSTKSIFLRFKLIVSLSNVYSNVTARYVLHRKSAVKKYYGRDLL